MRALDGIRVIDLGTYIAGPFCASILGEFGADVVKVERPGAGDKLRHFGTDTECGDTLVWLSEARNKRSMTLDLSDERGLEILRRMITTTDIVVENFRPGVLERWGLDYESMKKIRPEIVLVRVSAYGQTGPNREMPGFARIAHAFAGLTYLAGMPGEVPVTQAPLRWPTMSLGSTARSELFLRSRARETTGTGQVVDLALYETIFRMLDEMVPAFEQFGTVRERMGPDTVNVVPHSHYRTKDDHYIAIACTNDEMFSRLARVMGQPELALPETFGTIRRRLQHRDEVNQLVADWALRQTRDEALESCRTGQVPAGPIYSVRDICNDPQYRHRKNIVKRDSRIGTLSVPGPLPSLSATPGEINWLGPPLGSHTDEILGEIGLSPDDISALRRDGVA